MAISNEIISQQINSLIDRTGGLNSEEGRQVFVNGLTDIIVNAIKSADVVIPIGNIQVSGTAVAQTNPSPIILLGPLR